MIEHIQASLAEAHAALTAFRANRQALASVEQAATLLIDTFDRGGQAFSCGNGGSMCDAMHFAEEFTGRFRKNRPGVRAVAISDPSFISCVANDFGYDQVFARFIEANGKAGDALLAISTSGKSSSVLNAAHAARALGIRVIGLTGATGSPLESLCDVCICAPAGQYADRVQEMHIKIIHILIELVERQRFPLNYSET